MNYQYSLTLSFLTEKMFINDAANESYPNLSQETPSFGKVTLVTRRHPSITNRDNNVLYLTLEHFRVNS